MNISYLDNEYEKDNKTVKSILALLLKVYAIFNKKCENEMF